MSEPLKPIVERARRIVAAVAKASFEHDEHDVVAMLSGSADHTLAVRAVVLALRPPSVCRVIVEQQIGAE